MKPMKTTCLAILAVGSAQPFPPPRIELDMITMDPSSRGSSCSMRHQDYYVYNKADSDTCALASAKACGHNVGDPTATTRAFFADIDYAPADPAVFQAGGATDRTKRIKYPATYCDVQDAAGNRAEQVVFELVLNEEEKPSIINVQAGDPDCPDSKKSEAKDNIGGDLKYTIARPDQDYYVCTRHKADSDTRALPSAKMWDHNEGEPTAATRVFLADIDYAQVGGATDRTKRFKYPATNYDAQDVAGNHAEQAVLELVLNDKEKSSIVVRQGTNTNVQAGDPGGPDTDFEMCKSAAKDNIGGGLTNDLKYTTARPDGQLEIVLNDKEKPRSEEHTSELQSQG